MTLTQTLQELNYDHKKRVSIKTAKSMIWQKHQRNERHWDFNYAMRNQPHDTPGYAEMQMKEARDMMDYMDELYIELEYMEKDGIKTIKLNVE